MARRGPFGGFYPETHAVARPGFGIDPAGLGTGTPRRQASHTDGKNALS